MPVWRLKTPTTAQGGVLVAGITINEIIQKESHRAYGTADEAL